MAQAGNGIQAIAEAEWACAHDRLRTLIRLID
jgi:hypothetical protein